MAAEDLTDAIAEAAVAPSAVTVDGQSVSNRPIEEVIAADEYAKANQGLTKKSRGLRFTKLLPPGAV